MIKNKVVHMYRDCTIVSEPIEEYFKVTIHDNLSFEQILEEFYPIDTDFTAIQILTECEIFIDNYIENIESIGNVK